MKQFSISLGKPFGIPTKIHWTFWILILWIIYTNASQGKDETETLWYILFVFTIFACVVLHELGHSLAARRYGIKTKSITILPIGGVASLEKIPEDPRQELVVAFAGPLVNILIAFGLWIFLSTSGQLELAMEQVEEMTDIHAGNFLLALFSVNILLVVFNMIPAFPMDGGRVFRALLALKMDRVRATEWAVNVGKVFAILFVFWGFSSNPFLIFIALFIFLGAQAELEHVRSESYLGGHLVGDVLMGDFTLLKETSPLSQAVQVLLNGQEDNFLVTDGNRITGCLTKTDIIHGLTSTGEGTTIGQVMNKKIIWATADEPLQDLRIRLLKNGTSIAPVGKDGHLEGVIDLENINEFLLVKQAIKNRQHRLVF